MRFATKASSPSQHFGEHVLRIGTVRGEISNVARVSTISERRLPMIQKRIGISPHGFAFSSRRERAALAPVAAKPARAPAPDVASKSKKAKPAADPASREG